MCATSYRFGSKSALQKTSKPGLRPLISTKDTCVFGYRHRYVSIHAPLQAMNLVKKFTLIVLAASLVMQGCTTAPKNIPVKYVAPAKYQAYNCYQLNLEFQRVQAQMLELGGKLDEAASKDSLVGVFGAILFLPALLFTGGNSQQEAEYANLKGDVEAMQQVAFQKKCTAITPPAKTAAPAVTPATPSVPTPATVAPRKSPSAGLR